MQEDCYHKMYGVEEKHWWFQGKFAIALMLLAWAKAPGKRVLDIGCGTGFFSKMLIEIGYEVTSIDSSPLALEYSSQRGLSNLVSGDALKMPFPDGSFDAAFALDILEHLDDEDAALREWKRVLKPKGILIVFVPALSFLWGPQDKKLDHKRRYTRESLRKKLEKFLFVEKISYFNTLLFLPVFLSRYLFSLFPWLLKNRDELDITSKWLNFFLGLIFSLEKIYLTKFAFPFGVSLLSVSRKKYEQ